MNRGPDSSSRNRGTRFTSWRKGDRGPSLQDQFARVVRELHAPVGPGYQIFAVDGGRVRSLHLTPEASCFAVVGRHSECDLSMESDPAVSLRHLLLRVVTLESGGGSALRVIDLATPEGFQTDEGNPLAAVVAEGPFAFRIGRSAIFAIPWGVFLVPDLPAPSSVGSGVVPPVLPPSGHPYRDASRASRARWQTEITMVPPPSSLAPERSKLAAERVLTVRRGHHQTDVPKSLAALSSGVLLGRYARCDHAGRDLMGARVSRVHSLLLHEGGDDLLFDLASSNGTHHDGARVRRVLLRDGDRVELAPGYEDSIHLTWRHCPQSGDPLVWN